AGRAIRLGIHRNVGNFPPRRALRRGQERVPLRRHAGVTVAMTERQYRQVLKNGALRGERLFESATCASFLRTTARAVRLREQTQEAGQRLGESEWLPGAQIAAVQDGIATLECSAAVQREHIRRRAAALLRELKHKVRGLRDLQIAPPRASG